MKECEIVDLNGTLVHRAYFAEVPRAGDALVFNTGASVLRMRVTHVV